MSKEPGEALTGLHAEQRLHQHVLQQSVDEHILELLLPNGKPLEYETSLWDYKRSFPDTTGRNQIPSVEDAIAELVRDVIAFHNVYGGYIVAGIDHLSPEPLFGCTSIAEYSFTVEKLNEQVKKHTGKTINCRFATFRRANGAGADVSIGLLAIPMRQPSDPVVRAIKGSRETNGKSIISKGQIFARVDDRTQSAEQNADAIKLLCSPRQYEVKCVIRSIENNLPPRDPNLIRFIGRADYLLQLWNWQLERHQPVKVLTALGGTGKTAIAYEFCLQLLSSPPTFLDKIIWLSAKKQMFSALQGRYHKVTRVDFADLRSFLEALARELGVMDTEIEDAGGDVDDLQDLVLNGLMEFPSFIVVDDVDTLDLEQQGNLFSTIHPLAGRALEGGSRFLFTSRLDFGADSQRIQVEGFEGDEYADYVKSVSKPLGMNLAAGVITQLQRASKGSPVFTSSILRLASLGLEIHQAIKQWKGKEGEDVRRFAFARELDHLSEAEARTLYALTILGESTQIELGQILEMETNALTTSLAKLREFHLFASRDNPGTGAKLEVPEPIILMREVIAQRIPDPKRIERECARARSQAPKIRDKVALALGSIVALWRADEYEDALIVAGDAVKVNPKSGDLWCAYGQSLLKVTPSKFSEADKAFSKAWQNKCNRPELLPNWLETKARVEDWVGISDLAHQVPPSDIRDRVMYLVNIAEVQLAMQAIGRGDQAKAASRFKEAMQGASRAIAEGRAGEAVALLRDICRESAARYTSIVDRMSPRAGDRIDVFNAVYDAFRCHVSGGQLLVLGGEALLTWASDVSAREPKDLAAIRILERRLEQFGEIISLARKQEGRNPLILERLRDLEHLIGRELARARAFSG